MKKLLKTIYILLFVGIIFSDFLSCSNQLSKKSIELTEPDTTEETNLLIVANKLAYIKLSLGKADRTVTPNIDTDLLTDFRLTGTKIVSSSENEETVSESWENLSQMQNAVLPVSTGNWSFTLIASCNGTSFSGTLEKEIVLGENRLAFNLGISSIGTEKGSFNITLSFAGAQNVFNASYAVATLEKLDGIEVFREVITVNPDFLDSEYWVVIFTKTDVPVGTYRAKIKFYARSNQQNVNDFEIATYRELVQISSGLTSSATRQIESFEDIYKIKYYFDEGTLPEGTTLQETYTRKTSAITLPTLAKDYYTFDGWYTNEYFTDESKVTQIKDQLSDISVYAKFSPAEYTITYVFNDGVTPNETQKYTYFDEVSLKTPYYDGKTFYGWYEKEDFSCDAMKNYWYSYTHHKDITLYANWDGFFATSETIQSKIQSLTEDGTIVVTGELSAQDINNIKTAIKNCAESVYVSLDLSKVSGLDALSEGAFSDCSRLKTIVLPETIEIIENGAFSGCVGLTSLNIPDGVKTIKHDAFYNCTGLTSVTIPDSVTSIEFSAFYGCSGLTSLNIPGSVNTIGDSAFYNCTGLEQLVVSEGVTTIGYSSFYNCTGLKTIEIPQSLTTIKSNAFYCSSIRESAVYFKGTLEQWCAINRYSYDSNPCWCGAHLFIGDVELPEELEIPNTVKRIGFYSFSGCRIKRVTIPNTVEFIGAGAFVGCVYLTDVTMASNAPFSFDTGLDQAIRYHRKQAPFCSDEFLTDCKTKIKNVTICDGVTTIGNGIFSGCTELESVEIPNSVKNIGNQAFYHCTGLKGVSIPSSVLSIGEEAFCECHSLTGLIIPASITSMGIYAFRYCENLQSLEISTSTLGEGVFSCCINLSNLTINSSVKKIGAYAFERCLGLTSLYIPASVTSVGGYAFSNCENLTNLKLGNENDVVTDTIMTIDTFAFYESNLKNVDIYCNCAGTQVHDYESLFYLYNSENEINITIHDGVKIIGDYLFSSCTKFQNITIPDSVTSIGKYAFYNCSGLTSIDIPENVTSIGDYSFFNCSNLTSFTVPDNVTSIGEGAFAGCSSLVEISIPFVGRSINETQSSDATHFGFIFGKICWGPNAIEVESFYIPSKIKKATVRGGKIFEYSFSNCSFLEELVLDNIIEIGEYAFEGCTGIKRITIDDVTSIETGTFEGCTGLTNVTIGDGVLSIGNEAFEGCTGLTNVTIGDDVISIGKGSFAGCTELTNVIIGGNVKSIGEMAFYCCSNLTGITIPAGVTNIGESAFEGCTGFTNVTIGANELVIGDYAFRGCMELVSLTILNEITNLTIGNGAFNNCQKFNEIHFCGNLEQWCSIVWEITNINYNYDLYINEQKQTEIQIPSSITSIKECAFAGCKSITNVTIPINITSIGKNAFNRCSNLSIAVFETTNGWKADNTTISNRTLSNANTAATYLKSRYTNCTWTRTE